MVVNRKPLLKTKWSVNQMSQLFPPDNKNSSRRFLSYSWEIWNLRCLSRWVNRWVSNSSLLYQWTISRRLIKERHNRLCKTKILEGKISNLNLLLAFQITRTHYWTSRLEALIQGLWASTRDMEEWQASSALTRILASIQPPPQDQIFNSTDCKCKTRY